MDKELVELELLEWAEATNNLFRGSKEGMDYKGELFLFSESEGGRSRPTTHGYRAQHLIEGNDHTSGIIRFVDKDIVWPGEAALVFTKLVSPEYYFGRLRPGDHLEIYEGARRVGRIKLLEIYSKHLDANC